MGINKIDYKANKLNEAFIELILQYSKIHNITGAKNTKEIIQNIEDSIFPIQFLDSNPKTAIDIGTGGGFPGLVLAINMPQTKFFLIEPLPKRVSFLLLVKATLGLENVEILDKKIEEIDPFEVSLVTSRAVADTKTLLLMAKPFTEGQTDLIFYKGDAILNEELPKIHKIIENGKRKYLILKGKDAY